MSKQLPMAIKPSIIPTEQCNFQLIKIPNSEQSVGYIFRNLVIEVNSKTIHADVAYLLGIGEGWCTEYIGGKNNYTYCQYPADGFHYRKNIYKGITLEQLQILWEEALERCDVVIKYKPILAELIETEILPLFNQVKSVTVKPDANGVTITNNQPLTMSSQEIADLLECRHDSVKRTMERLQDKGLISFTPMVEPTKGGGKPTTVYHVNKRDSYVVVARLSPEFTAKLVDRWQELETQLAHAVSPTRVEIKTDHLQPSKQVNASFLKIAIAQIDMMNLPAERKQILKAHLMHEQAGLPLDLMLPVVYEEKLSPAQIALRMNVSAQAIGHIITKLGIRGNETYCEPRLSYVERSNRDVIVHFYNNQAINMIKQALKDKQNEKKN